MLFKNNYYFHTNGSVSSRQYNYYEPRVKGRYYLKPVRYSANFELSTDARKPLSFDAGYGFSTQPAIRSMENAIEIGANLRLGQQFVFNYEIEGHKS